MCMNLKYQKVKTQINKYRSEHTIRLLNINCNVVVFYEN